jgi:ligand-binding sensor domain-containing protein
MNKNNLKIFIMFLLISIGFIYGDWERINDSFFKNIGIIHDFSKAGCAIQAATDSGVFWSGDSGKTWKMMANSPKNVLSLDDNTIAGTRDSGIYDRMGDQWSKKGSIEISPINAIIDIWGNYIIGTNSGLYHRYYNKDSKNKFGLDYYKINSLSSKIIKYLTVGIHPIEEIGSINNVYVGSDSGFFMAQIYVYYDSPLAGSANWQSRNNGLTNLKIRAVAAPEFEYVLLAGIILIGTEDGVFISVDTGLTWKAFNEGLGDERKNITALEYTDCSFLYAATYSNGQTTIWRRPLTDITSVTTIPKNIHSQVSNLEFNVSNNILKYKLSKTSDVEIRIYDLKGKVVYNTRFYNQMQGEYLFSLMQRGINAGVYILELKAVGNKIQKPINIIRR